MPRFEFTLCQEGHDSVRFSYGLCMERFTRFQFSVPTFALGKGLLVTSVELEQKGTAPVPVAVPESGSVGSGSSFGFWKNSSDDSCLRYTHVHYRVKWSGTHRICYWMAGEWVP